MELVIYFSFYPTADSLSSSIKCTIELEDINDNPPNIQNGGPLATIAEDVGKPVMYLYLYTDIFIYYL